MLHFHSGNAVFYSIALSSLSLSLSPSLSLSLILEKVVFPPKCSALALPAEVPCLSLVLHAPWYVATNPKSDATQT